MMHYTRLRRTGDPLTPSKNGKVLRFIHDVALKHDTDGCLLWPYTKNPMGYGLMRWKPGGHSSMVHRLVCELAHGEPPPDRPVAAHWCGNPSCVAPGHLRWATHKENSGDMLRHGTLPRGSQHRRSKLTEADVLAIRAQPHRRHADLAAEFGVHLGTIETVIYRRGWRHI